MDVDWVVGIVVFMFFVTWGFSYYFTLFEEGADVIDLVANTERDKVMGFLTVDVYEVPVRYNSTDDVSDGVLKAKSIWYHGEKAATRVYSGENLLGCRISGDDLYWQDDVSAGMNEYEIQTADLNSTTNCTGTFSISSSNLTYPWAFEKSGMISLLSMDNMTSMSYEDFRDYAGMNEDFRILIEREGATTEYGKSIPAGPLNVNSMEFQRMVLETLGTANVTIAIW